jgi:hypothetical protein
MKRSLLVALLLGLAAVVVSSPVAAAQNCNSAPSTSYSASGAQAYANWCSACGGTPTGNFSCNPGSHWGRRASSDNNSSDNSAAEAAAERQRIEAADAERRRKEAEEQRLRDEAEARRRKEKFDLDKQNALDSMKDLDGGSLGFKPGGTDSLGLKPLDGSDSNVLGLKDAPNSTSSQKALDDANSNLVTTRQGLQSTTPESKTRGHRSVPTGTGEDASGQARNVFDSAGDRHAASINTGAALRNVGTPPSLRALMKHIPPAAMNNPTIQTNVTYYQRMENEKAEARSKIAEVQKEIDNYTGNPTILSAKKTQLANQVKFLSENEQAAVKTIKKTLNDLSLPWIVDSPANAGAGAGAGTGKGKTQ